MQGLGFRVYPTDSFPGMVFNGIYRVSLFVFFAERFQRDFWVCFELSL